MERAAPAVFKFAPGGGCQLQPVDILDAVAVLNAFIGEIEIAQFLEVSFVCTEASLEHPYDLVIVEGAISSNADHQIIWKGYAYRGREIGLGSERNPPPKPFQDSREGFKRPSGFYSGCLYRKMNGVLAARDSLGEF